MVIGVRYLLQVGGSMEVVRNMFIGVEDCLRLVWIDAERRSVTIGWSREVMG